MDFGLARDWQRDTTVTGTVLGTPHYMAPEQARGEVSQLDRRADVYSLGATLYHLLLGQPPIPGSNGLEVLNRIPTEEPRPPRALDPNVPADLEAIVLKCLEKDRSARYDSARALAEDLERFLAGEPVLARSGGWYRLKKRLRKHRRVVAIASTAMAVALLAVGWGALGRREAALRERLARRFTERVEQVEAQARYSDLSPLHDVRADQRALRARMDELEEEIREGGERALGPGQYALGRGYLALGDEAKARAHLESAWAHGFREPRVAYALGLVMGRLYQEQLLEARCIQNRARRAARVAEVERAYREPALQYLRQSAGAEVPSEDYLAALLAFHEDRHEDALSRLEAAAGKLPWFYEAPQLRGDVLVARAYRRWDAGDGAGARADFDAGRGAYAQAAAIGESVPGIHRARARLELLALQAELYGQGDIMPSFERGQQALANALAASPDHYPSRLLRARFYRRLAEYRRNHGGEVEEPVGKALEAAHAAHALAPEHLDARKELAQIHWIQGAYLEGRSKDPTDPLRQAVALFESIGPGARNYEFHQDLGLVFTTWADYEDQTGADSAAHRSKAIEEFQAAIALDERVPAAWSNVGTAYLSRAALPTAADPEGDLEKAREALGKAQALNPQYVVPYYYAGRASELLADRHHERGQDARPELLRALEQYRKGLGINPKFLALLNGEGSTLLSLAREEWDRGGDPFPSLEQARKSFERMLELEPKQLAALNNAGEAYARRAQFQRKRGEDPAVATRQAADFFRRTMALLPDRSTPWTNLALAQSDLALFELEHGRDPRGSVATAWEAAQAALERNPKDPK
ncbi:MAG TPA: protein kinase, partial [Longimicrobium sp.]|nr:protein kinase [Longimicrobium sp.]